MCDILAVIFIVTWVLGWLGLMIELFSVASDFDCDHFLWVAIITLCPVVNFVLWLIIYSKRLAKLGVKTYLKNALNRIKKFFVDDLAGCINEIKAVIRNV